MVKIVTLILSFIFVVVPIAQMAQANELQEASFSFEYVSSSKNPAAKEFSKEAKGISAGTASAIVFNVKIKRLLDKNGNEYYSKVEWFADIDTKEPTNCYVVVYANNNKGGWWTSEFMKSEILTINGYDPEEGIGWSTLFYSGYEGDERDEKIELYYENGVLAYTYGPEDDPDLSVLIESQEYDVKMDPFIPTPTPTPCEPDTISVDPESLMLANKTSEEVTVTVTGADGCAVEGVTVKAMITSVSGEKRITVSPFERETDEKGQATFAIAAKRNGKAKVAFQAGNLEKTMTVKVSKK